MKKKTDNSAIPAPRGLTFPRLLSPESGSYSQITWDHRTAEITDDKGNKIFSLENVEVPDFWSQLATNVVASKYFRRAGTSGEQETSVRQIIDRVVDTITAWGEDQGYFAASEDAVVFSDELKYIIVNQMATFNSPVWFNVGIDEQPVVSACFINSVEDTMESIMELATTEAMLFKGGSGSGTNLSTLRSSKEKLSSGGQASGPVSFMRGYDAFAGVIKSAGRTRRAACLRALNVDHPDILEFIDCKVGEEKKACALMDAGYDGGLNSEAYATVSFQNANNTVRVTDDFMQAVVNDEEYSTEAVMAGEPVESLNARDVLKRIAEATHFCGDPGLQFDDTINRWNTCSSSGRINTSNPCLAGDMSLLTADGYRTFRDLAKQGTVSLVNYKGDISEGYVWSSGFRNILRVTFYGKDNDQVIKCTSDHVFMLNDGSYKEAEYLSRGDRLMPFVECKENFDHDLFLAGFIQGDGCTSRLNSAPHKGIEVHIGFNDYDIADMYGWEVKNRCVYSNHKYHCFR